MSDGCVTYDFPTGEVYGLREEVVQARKGVRDPDRVSTTVTLKTVPVTFCAHVSRVNLPSIRRGYNDYCRQKGGRDEAKRAWDSSGRDFDASYEKDL